MTILLLDRLLSDETFGSNKKLILGLLLNFKYTWSFNNFQCVKFWIKFWISSFKSILGNSISLLKEVLLVLSQPGRVGDALLNALFRPIRCPEYIFQDNKISRISCKPLDFEGSSEMTFSTFLTLWRQVYKLRNNREEKIQVADLEIFGSLVPPSGWHFYIERPNS